jgi:hypothetical protein
MLNHWMVAMLGGDYYGVTTHVAPDRLLAPPPSFSTCVAELQAIVPKSEGKPRLDSEQIRTKCKQLYEVIKEQAMSFLINAQLNISQGAAYGVEITQAEVDNALKRLRGEQFRTEAAFLKFLAEQHRTLSDEQFLLKLDLLNQRGHPKVVEALLKGAGGQKGAERRAAAYGAKLKAETTCRSGYVVAQCRQSSQSVSDPSYSGPSPAALLLEIGRWQPATSHGFTK